MEKIRFFSLELYFACHPLFSCAITFCTLVFLYLPHDLFLKIVFSPVLILTSILLLAILRLGAIQNSQHEERENREKDFEHGENRGSREEKQSSSPIEAKETKSTEKLQNWISSQMNFESSSFFVEWDVKAPLEVIYEEYEGQEETGEDSIENQVQRYPSLSRYHPESDSDSSSSESEYPATREWESSPEKNCFFRWDDEEEREGLIEIAFDGCCKNYKRGMELNLDEENLIEIDISPMRYKELSGMEEDEVFSGEISCH